MDAYTFETIFNTVFLLLSHLFLNVIFTRRYPLGWTLLIQLLQTGIVVFICWLIPNDYAGLKLFIIPVLTLGLVILIFRERWWSSALVTGCYIILEAIMMMLFYPGDLEGESLGTLITAWLPLTMATVFALWLVFLGLRLCQNRMGLREVLMYALFPVSQFLLFYGWNRLAQVAQVENGHDYMILALIFSLAADMVLFGLMFQLNRQKSLEAENWLLIRQIQAQKEHYSELTAQYDSIRRMRHDIQKHITAMDSLLSAGRSEKAAAYVSELRASEYDASLGICEHPVVDAFLHNTIQSALGAGMTVQAAVSIPEDIALADTDLVCTFGNLLDNALEACVGLEGACIRVESYVAGGCLVIRAENPVFSSGSEKAVRIPGLDRGIGMRVLADLAEKYDGRFSYEQEGDLFRAEIIYRLDVR